MQEVKVQPSSACLGVQTMECSLCLETYKDPRALPCKHTFCLSCLQKQAAIGASSSTRDTHVTVTCALCRSAWDDLTLEDLPTNLVIQEAIMSFPSMTVCGSVESGGTHGDVEFFCIECWEPLCSLCYDGHKRTKLTRKHSVKVVSDINEDDITQHCKNLMGMCSIHIEEELKLYCKECEELICIFCNVKTHSKHICITLEEADRIFKGKIKNNLILLKNKEMKLTKQIKDAEESLKSLIDEEVKCLDDVQLFYNDICEKLVKDFEHMYSEIKTYQNTTSLVVLNMTNIEKIRLRNLLSSARESLFAVKQNIAQHEVHLSFIKSIFEKSMYLKSTAHKDGMISPSIEHKQCSFQYKLRGVDKWRRNVTKWLQPVNVSMSQITSTFLPIKENFLLFTLKSRPKYPVSATVADLFVFHPQSPFREEILLHIFLYIKANCL